MNVTNERAEHRMFHIMLDKFGTFTMTIGGFSFDIYYSLHDGKYLIGVNTKPGIVYTIKQMQLRI